MQPSNGYMYVSYQDADRISIYTVDTATGAIAWKADVSIEGGPAPLALSPDKDVMHVGRRGSQELSSYRVDRSTGGLSLIGTVPLQGEPVYVATDRTGVSCCRRITIRARQPSTPWGRMERRRSRR